MFRKLSAFALEQKNALSNGAWSIATQAFCRFSTPTSVPFILYNHIRLIFEVIFEDWFIRRKSSNRQQRRERSRERSRERRRTCDR